jgi:hypothetical protein
MLNAITLDDMGSAGYLDWVGVKIYLDESMITQLPYWDGNPVTLPLGQVTVNNGTSRTISVFYDISTGIGGTTFQSKITGVGAEWPNSGVTGLSFTSNLLTVDDCPTNTAKTSPGICGCSYYDVDIDQDGHFCCGDTPDDSTPDCDGYLLDCDDSDDTFYPVSEVCDGIDNDCTWGVPSDETDDDTDGYVECTIDAGGWNGDPSVTGGDDCDDTDLLINPDTVWYLDSDGDGYGNPSVAYPQCPQPTDTVLDNTDCNDSDQNLNPAGKPVRLFDVPPVYYFEYEIQIAYELAPDSSKIQLKAFPLPFGLNVYQNKTVTFESGYDCGYENADSVTILDSMNITEGKVILDKGTLVLMGAP